MPAGPERDARLRERRQRLLGERFQVMDSDGDGLVSLQEFVLTGFQQLDRDGDGVLTAAELRPPGRRGPRRPAPPPASDPVP